MTRFLTGKSQLLDSQYALSWVFSPLVEAFGKISSPTLLILFCVIWMLLKRDQLSKKELWFGLYSFASFYVINLINKTRYLDAPQYRIFSEFFLLAYTLLLISRTSKRLQIKVLSSLIFLTVLANMVPYTHYYNWLIRKGNHPYCQSEVVHVHLKMDEKRIAEECLKPGPEH